jgi:hypothetical protein
MSTSKRIDGLWVGTWETGGKARTVLERVEEALRLIKTYDPLRYRRIGSDLERVWVDVLLGSLGNFAPAIKTCKLDTRFILADTSSPEVIASIIVHEATHARLWTCGIAYEEGLRARVEAVCLRREIAFSAKLPLMDRSCVSGPNAHCNCALRTTIGPTARSANGISKAAWRLCVICERPNGSSAQCRPWLRCA